jgi:hypothetical protein
LAEFQSLGTVHELVPVVVRKMTVAAQAGTPKHSDAAINNQRKK